MVRGRYLYTLRSKVKVTTELCQHVGSDTITWIVFNIEFSYFIHRSMHNCERKISIYFGFKVLNFSKHFGSTL